MRVNPARREGAFTIIEVIIAAFIVAVVVAAAAVAMSGALRGESKAKVTSRGRAVAAAILRKMQADTGWIATCAAVPATPAGADCTVPTSSIITPGDRLLTESEGTINHDVRITVSAVDLPADQLGAADLDSRTTDVYRVHVTDRLSGSLLPAGAGPFTADGIVNPSVRGVTGTLRVRMCAIDGQVDERLGLGLCSSGINAAPTRSIPLEPPIAGSCAGPANTLFCMPWNAAEAADNSLSERYTDVRVRPMDGASVSLVGPLVGATTTRTVTMTSSGSVDVLDLSPGQYRVVAPAAVSWGGGSWIGWSSHSVPSSGHLVVEKGGLREATMLMRPAPPTVRLNVETYNRTNPLAPVMEPRARFTATIRLLAVPNGRSTLERGTAQSGWTTVPVGASNVDLRDAAPGLYAAHVVHYPRGDISRLVGGSPYVWIDPSGTTVPAVLTVRQDYCDLAARNAIVQAQCGIFRWCWVGPTFVGECNDNPTPGGPAATGAGGA